MPGDRIAFRAPDINLGDFGLDSVARLASGSGDVALILSADGRILDASFTAGDPTGAGQDSWIGRNWSDLVTVESRPKIAEMVAAAATTSPPKWRQVNHPTNNGDVPIRYLAVGSGADGNIVAIGQDLRAT